MSENIPELIEYVKDQLAYHNSQSSRKQHNGQETKASLRHAEAVKHLKSILSILENKSPENTVELNVEDLFTISPSEIKEMPENLSKVLNLQETDILESQVLKLLEIADRPLSLKELIIGLFKKYDYTVKDRNPFASKLYRMKDASLIESPKKGHYALPGVDLAVNEKDRSK